MILVLSQLVFGSNIGEKFGRQHLLNNYSDIFRVYHRSIYCYVTSSSSCLMADKLPHGHFKTHISHCDSSLPCTESGD